MRRSWLIALAGFLLAVATTAMLAVPAVRESQTQDEAVYVVSGLSYWRTGDFRLNPEHPPLVKLLLALPLVFRGAEFSPDPVAWAEASQWDLAPRVLYRNVIPGPELLVSARLVNVVLALMLAALCVYWAWRTFGGTGAIVTAGLAAFEPNLLAMGHLATTDTGYALAMLGSIVAFLRWLERPGWLRLVTAAVAFTLAILTRFNALLLVGLLPAVYLTVVLVRRGNWKLPMAKLAGAAGIFALTAFLGVWLAYGFELRPLNQPQDQPAREALAGIPGVAGWIESTPFPSASYMSGLLFQLIHARDGQWAYLAGQISHSGWWYYFPVALLVKLTIATLILAGVGIFRSVRAAPRGPTAPVFSSWVLLTVAGGIFVSALPSRLDLGVRYVLPLIAVMTVLAGGAASIARKRFGAFLVAGFLIWHIFSVGRNFPHWIPYANESIGGPAKLDRVLIDSNLDWGQDIPLVAEYMRTHEIDEYDFQSFSTAPAEPYGAYERAIPTDDQPEAVRKYRGVVAIGKSALWYPTMKYEWLRRLIPDAVLGHSVNVYDLR